MKPNLLVVATGHPVPTAGRRPLNQGDQQVTVIGTETPVSVPNSIYYRKRLAAGELREVKP